MINEKDYQFKVTAAGRVNLIGDHVDYCGGKILPAALSLNNAVYIRPNGTDKINLSWTTLPDRVTLDLNRLEQYRTLKYGNYQAGSAYVWQRAGHKVVGCDMLHDCSVPFGSGLSSSAAIEVSTIAALAAIAGESFDLVEIALLAQRAEHEFSGVLCGIMDQYSSACGRKDCAMLLDCNTLNCEYIPVNFGDYELVIINSNKPHNLAESKYNERRAESEEALRILNTRSSLSCLADLTAEGLEACKNLLGDTLYRRARHVAEECGRVQTAAQAMRSGDIKTLGKLFDESHNSLRDLYEVTGREMDSLVAAARSHPACIGSRMTGGGFGGCTVSLVKREDVEDFKKTTCEKYGKTTGYHAECYDAKISDGITVRKL